MNEIILILTAAIAPAIGLAVSRINKFIGTGLVLLVSGLAVAHLWKNSQNTTGLIFICIWNSAMIIYLFLSDSKNAEIKAHRKFLQLLAERNEMGKKLEMAKSNFINVQKEEKKALILYSAVKLLSDAMSVESVKNRLAKYIEDYFETKDFAFYVNAAEGFRDMHLLARGSTENSVLHSWQYIYEILKKINVGVQFIEPAKLDGAKVSEGVNPVKNPPCPQGTAIAASGRLISNGVNGNPLTVISPVMFNEELIGCLAANFADCPDAEKLLENMKAFCDEISFALKRIRLFQEVEYLSRIDGLTGVCRRNVLDEKIQEEIKRARTFKTTCGFMIVDIDHFKNLNDKYGHQFGDAILKRIGEILKSSVYETDFVARYGGEEFGIILPRAEYSGVMRKAEAIRSRIEQESFPQGFECVKISVSIGISHFPRDGKDASAVISKADEALYKAKRDGRNRVVDSGS